jgi:hypothetical protein
LKSGIQRLTETTRKTNILHGPRGLREQDSNPSPSFTAWRLADNNRRL